MIQVSFPFEQFLDLSGLPLDSGYVFIGSANQNPETNPVAVYWDAALTIPAAQPIRTINGYLSRNGSPGRLYTSDSAFSITVKNKNLALVTSALDASTLDNLRADLAASTGAGLLGWIQLGIGAVKRWVSAKLYDTLSVKDFGVIGGGVIDDTAALIVAITAAVTRANSGLPTTLWFPTDIYKISGVLGTYACSNLTIDFNGSIIDASQASFTGALLRFNGGIGAYTALTSSGVEGDDFLLTDTTGFVRGDWVKIISDSVWDASNTDTRYGELNKIPTSDNATDTLPPTRMYLAAPLATGYLTTQAAKVAKLSMLTNISIRNGQLLGPSAGRDSAAGLRFDYVDGLRVTGMAFSGFDDRSIYIKDSSGSLVTGCRFGHTRPVALGYGVSFVDASQDSVVSLCNFEDVRHALSTNNNTSTDYGITRRITFDANTVLYSARASVTSSTFTANAAANTITMGVPSSTFSEGRLVRLTSAGTLPGGTSTAFNYYLGEIVASTTFSLHLTIADALALANPVDITDTGSGAHTATAYTGGDAVDTHGGADFIKITNNQIVGASGSGINVEGANAEIIGNTVMGSEAYGIYFHSEADRVGSVIVANNRIERSGAAGVLVSQGSRGTAFEMRRIVVSGNSIRYSGQAIGRYAFSQGLNVNGTAGTTQDCMSITGNSIMDGAVGGMYVEELNGGAITGNSLFNNAGTGIRAHNSAKVSIAGNAVLTPSTSADDGITLTGTSTNIAITGNSISSVSGTVTGAGISVADTVTNATVGPNSVSGYSTHQALGIGAGHSGLTATGSASYDPASLADGAGTTTTVTATGASLGDTVRASFSLDLQGITLTAWVSSSDTVSVRFQNESGGTLDLASGSIRVWVERIG